MQYSLGTYPYRPQVYAGYKRGPSPSYEVSEAKAARPDTMDYNGVTYFVHPDGVYRAFRHGSPRRTSPGRSSPGRSDRSGARSQSPRRRDDHGGRDSRGPRADRGGHASRPQISLSPDDAPRSRGPKKQKFPDVPVDASQRVYYDAMKAFATDPSKPTYDFPVTLNADERAAAHLMADHFGFYHFSVDVAEGQKVVRVSREPLFEGQYCPRGMVQRKEESDFSIPMPPSDPKELPVYEAMKNFVLHSKEQSYTYPASLSHDERAAVHAWAERFDLEHQSEGPRGGERVLTIRKADPKILRATREQAKLIKKALETYKVLLAEASDDDNLDAQQSVPKTPTPSAPHGVRYVNWNIEWMDHIFQDDTTFRDHIAEDHVDDVPKLCHSIADTIHDLHADVVAVEEGPENIERMRLFVREYLDDNYTVLGGIDGDKQRIYFLVRKDGRVKNPQMCTEADEWLSQPWQYDVQGNCQLSEYSFTRRPTCVMGEVTIEGKKHVLVMIALHTKSKFVNSGERMWESRTDSERQKFIQKSVANRRRIAAECARTRRCIDRVILPKYKGALVIVSGDLNDGPGLDFFEEFYLMFDSINALLGSIKDYENQRSLHSVLTDKKLVAHDEMWSAVFDDYVDKVNGRKVMLDHVLVNHRVYGMVNGAGVAHDIFGRHSSVPGGRNRADRPSDHRPVFVDFGSDK